MWVYLSFSIELPRVCSPLLVVNNANRKRRLVINLKYLNRFVLKEEFKYEDIRTLLSIGDYMTSFDLKSGYHHIDIHKDSQEFLGFEWKGRYFVFTVLPFGLSSACYVFTKVLRPLVKYWRAQGIRVVLYIDDGIALASSVEEGLVVSKVVQRTLGNAGFVCHPDKSCWAPVQVGVWLGFNIDLSNGIIAVPEDKVTSLKQHLLDLSQNQSQSVPARALAGVIGRIISMGLGIVGSEPVVCMRCWRVGGLGQIQS